MEIPEKYEDVTAEWLTAALREGNVIGDATITDFKVDPLGADRSRTSSLARFELTYYGPPDGLPRSLFAKFVSRIPGNRAFASGAGLFHREIELYRNLGEEIPLDMPRFYYGAESGDSDLAVLLLEEVDALPKPADVPAEEAGLTEQEGILALTRVANMHAAWWESARLSEYSWLGSVDGDVRKRLYGEYPDAWTKLKPVVESTLTPEASTSAIVSNHSYLASCAIWGECPIHSATAITTRGTCSGTGPEIRRESGHLTGKSRPACRRFWTWPGFCRWA